MKTMRLICDLNKRDSLRAMLMCIHTIEKNFLIDDEVSSKEYEVLIYHLDRLYDNVKKELLKHEY